MWRVVCIGPGSRNSNRRTKDRGPFLPSKEQADAFADWLRSTGLYDAVTVERHNRAMETQLIGDAQKDDRA